MYLKGGDWVGGEVREDPCADWHSANWIRFTRGLPHDLQIHFFVVACNNHSISANPATLSPQHCVIQIHRVSQETRVRGFTAEQRFERFPLAREPTTDDLSA